MFCVRSVNVLYILYSKSGTIKVEKVFEKNRENPARMDSNLNSSYAIQEGPDINLLKQK